MKLNIGTVVRANAGRDCGKFFAVIRADKDFCFIADGKSRKLANPKRKNIKHLSTTGSMVEIKDITDKKLRQLLKNVSAAE